MTELDVMWAVEESRFLKGFGRHGISAKFLTNHEQKEGDPSEKHRLTVEINYQR